MYDLGFHEKKELKFTDLNYSIKIKMKSSKNVEEQNKKENKLEGENFEDEVGKKNKTDENKTDENKTPDRKFRYNKPINPEAAPIFERDDIIVNQEPEQIKQHS